MYKSIIQTDLILVLTVAFSAVLIVAGVIARALRWVITAHTDKANATAALRQVNLSLAAGSTALYMSTAPRRDVSIWGV